MNAALAPWTHLIQLSHALEQELTIHIGETQPVEPTSHPSHYSGQQMTVANHPAQPLQLPQPTSIDPSKLHTVATTQLTNINPRKRNKRQQKKKNPDNIGAELDKLVREIFKES